jgi:hypothetical protein
MKDKARELFERSVQELDDAAVKRLRLARRSALAGAGEASTRWRGWPAGLAVTAVLVLGAAWWWPQAATSPPAQSPVAAVKEANVDEPVLDEAGEEADLYAWLAEAPVASEKPGHRL